MHQMFLGDEQLMEISKVKKFWKYIFSGIPSPALLGVLSLTVVEPVALQNVQHDVASLYHVVVIVLASVVLIESTYYITKQYKQSKVVSN